METWLNGGAPLAVVIAHFFAEQQNLLFSFAGLDLCLSVHRRTRRSSKLHIILVAGHVLVRASVL
jgi:hypothetical protein